MCILALGKGAPSLKRPATFLKREAIDVLMNGISTVSPGLICVKDESSDFDMDAPRSLQRQTTLSGIEWSLTSKDGVDTDGRNALRSAAAVDCRSASLEWSRCTQVYSGQTGVCSV